MFLDTQPAALAASGGIDPYAEFRVSNPREIAALLRQLAADATPVVLSGPDAAGLTTVIWTIDTAQQRINFSADAESPQLQRLIELEEATCVAYLDAVKLQFDVDHLVLVRGSQACSLQSDMPREMYRFQRRRSFRVRTLGRGTPTALLRHPSMPDMQLGLRVLDVSIGGCALMLPADVPPLSAGLEIRGVRIELDPDTRFDTDLLLHHVTVIQTPSRGSRLGCEFMHVQPQAQRALQRYIDQTQKRRRLLSLD
ncbi:MAG TPA: flagellar regulator YcgR PilZN domain-containing protein [Steroidobacteraceae bacterium]|jgi:c-di-GMP-binding flagellar brake protein YcgR|nr:flagellar regulator YcgR PilZN domain-containing protein [Steroidobacteraceae bacterium]